MWNSPHNYSRYNFSFLLKPSLPFQATNLVPICLAEESSVSAPWPQGTPVGYTRPSSGAAGLPTAPWKLLSAHLPSGQSHWQTFVLSYHCTFREGTSSLQTCTFTGSYSYQWVENLSTWGHKTKLTLGWRQGEVSQWIIHWWRSLGSSMGTFTSLPQHTDQGQVRKGRLTFPNPHQPLLLHIFHCCSHWQTLPCLPSTLKSLISVRGISILGPCSDLIASKF